MCMCVCMYVYVYVYRRDTLVLTAEYHPLLNVVDITGIYTCMFVYSCVCVYACVCVCVCVCLYMFVWVDTLVVTAEDHSL